MTFAVLRSKWQKGDASAIWKRWALTFKSSNKNSGRTFRLMIDERSMVSWLLSSSPTILFPDCSAGGTLVRLCPITSDIMVKR